MSLDGLSPTESPRGRPVVEVSGLSKRYARDLRRAQRLGVRAIFDEVRPARKDQVELAESEFWAVRDVSFSVHRGEAVGIVGRNGAGKSTLLRLIAGITKPSEGAVATRGSIGVLLDPNAGFDLVLTGRENLEVGYSLIGGRRPSAQEIDRVARYAGLAEVLDAPVRTYSQGMRLRLGFSVVVHTEPDVLVIDEALAVGDTAFQLQCLDQLHAFCRAGGALVFVSHSLWLFQNMATTGVHLSEGRVALLGSPEEVADHYLGELQEGSWVELGGGPDPVEREGLSRRAEGSTDGDGHAAPTAPRRPVTIAGIVAEGAGGGPVRTGGPVSLRFDLVVHEAVDRAEAALTIWTGDLAICVVGDLSRDVRGGRPDGDLALPVGRHALRYEIDALPLTPGRYALRAAVYQAPASDVVGLHGYEDTPSWMQVLPADAGPDPAITERGTFSGAPRLRPLRTIAVEAGTA